MRSLIVAIYELGVEEIMVVAHSHCGACHMSYDHFHHEMIARGVTDDTLDTIRKCGIDLDQWLEGFKDTPTSVRKTVETIKTHRPPSAKPLRPSKPIHLFPRISWFAGLSLTQRREHWKRFYEVYCKLYSAAIQVPLFIYNKAAGGGKSYKLIGVFPLHFRIYPLQIIRKMPYFAV